MLMFIPHKLHVHSFFLQLYTLAYLEVKFFRGLKSVCDFCLPFQGSQTEIVCTYFHSVKTRVPQYFVVPSMKSRKYYLSLIHLQRWKFEMQISVDPL